LIVFPIIVFAADPSTPKLVDFDEKDPKYELISVNDLPLSYRQLTIDEINKQKKVGYTNWPVQNKINLSQIRRNFNDVRRVEKNASFKLGSLTEYLKLHPLGALGTDMVDREFTKVTQAYQLHDKSILLFSETDLVNTPTYTTHIKETINANINEQKGTFTLFRDAGEDYIASLMWKSGKRINKLVIAGESVGFETKKLLVTIAKHAIN